MTNEELKQQFYKYIKDHEDYFDPREPWTERIILQIWLDCAEPREKRIADLEKENQLLKADLDFNAKQANKTRKNLKEFQELVDEYSSEGADLQDKITELEKENKVLTQNLEDTEIVNKALEKENAELKGLVNQYKASKCGSISLVNRNMIMFDQLTKARKLLKTLIEDYVSEPGVFPDGSCEDNELRNLIKEVEQFLKENEE